MSEESIVWVASKSPQGNGSKRAVFSTITSATTWLEKEIEDDAQVLEYEREDNPKGPWPEISYRVVEGNGSHAGNIRKAKDMLHNE